jgi:hypothetical protein
MLGDIDPKAKPGDIVAVYDKADAPYGAALYNPRASSPCACSRAA